MTPHDGARGDARKRDVDLVTAEASKVEARIAAAHPEERLFAEAEVLARVDAALEAAAERIERKRVPGADTYYVAGLNSAARLVRDGIGGEPE